ncbi:HEAT repeat domain-containing protein [Pseudanabaena sp. FACHB-2040]|uniref:HEAT repeat domain-containing protein n=1 Tax=Pseudanabaena sp. FACHB-2040 TaxID=2692859 RepID=UPI001683412E|nr:HEAT repeat domain-containing protein [Pseudanabaena sp. FACHB-2040]MBD2259109.1 hypothetical protein [Pseudanabaena sp. FACHB-2040]
MAKSRKLEELIDALNQIRSNPTSELGLITLRQAITSRYGVVAAQAAHLIAQFEIYLLLPELVTAFDRFLINPKDSDPGCRAKQAIAEALYRLEHSDETLFLKGIRHVQWEPIWGGQVDAAPKLRGTCALGLVRMHYPAAMIELADLLADPEPEARIGAARAIAYSEHELGVALLRLRVKVGDTPPVLGECLIALLELAPMESLPLVQELLQLSKKSAPDDLGERAEVAALALGESRLPEAFPILREWWQQTTNSDLRRTGLLAIATLRQDPALEFLLALIADGSLRDAKDALKALSIYKEDERLWQKIRQTVERRGDLLLDL